MLNAEQTVKIIKDCIDKKTPFLLTRCGDGESMIVDGDRDKIDFVTKRQFGIVLYDFHIWKLRASIIEAYVASDIIGVPTDKHHKLSYHWKNAEKMLKIRVFNLDKKGRCSIDGHTDMLKDDLYKDWLTDLEEIYIISSRDVGEGLCKKYGIKDAYQFKISPEKKFDDSEPIPHFPNQFEEVCRWIPNDTKGKVLIFGAGCAGKIYGKWWKDRGGIAVDLGHVFDLWSGKVTRGKNRGKDSFDETYKL